MTLKNRLAKLEQRRKEQPYDKPEVIEVWGARMDGTQYLYERRVLDSSGNYVIEKNKFGKG